MTSNLEISKNPEVAHYLIDQGFLALGLMQQTSGNHEKTHFSLCNQQLSCQVLGLGVVLFEPKLNSVDSVADIVLSCGIHGNETGPIEMLDAIVKDIIAGKIIVRNRLLCILGNPLATSQEKRFEEENLNRLFSGLHQGRDNYEAKRAAELEQHLERFFQHQNSNNAKRIHYDLHTAIRGSKYSQFIVCPHQEESEFDQDSLAFFQMCGIKTALLSHKPSGTFSYLSSHQHGAQAFTVELGKVKPFGKNNPENFKKIMSGLSCLIEGQKFKTKHLDTDKFEIFEVKHELLKLSDSFVLNLDDDVQNFQHMPLGYQLTNDIDGGFTITQDDLAIVFPNENIPVGQRAGLLVSKAKIQ